MSRAASPDQRGVVASASAGDKVAFAQIVAAHHEDMRRVCSSMAEAVDVARPGSVDRTYDLVGDRSMQTQHYVIR